MAIYVDTLMDWGWRLGPSCHLFADTNEELHEFAEKLGLKRRWFQARVSGPHYDLVASKRAKAVRQGAIELSLGETGEFFRAKRRELVERLKLATTDEEREVVKQWFFR